MIQKLISKKLLNSVHDISSGGLLLGIAEMCIFGDIGAKIKKPKDRINPHEYFFGEDQSRYIVEVNQKNKDEVCKILEKNSVYYEIIGSTKKEGLELEKEFDVKLSDLYKINSFWFRNFFNEN